MRIDAHQHYWKYDRGDYEWMAAPAAAALRRDYLPRDLEPELAREGFHATVVVQAAATQAESEFLLELARTTPSIAAVVGWLELDSAGFARDFDELTERPKLAGLRPMLQDLPDDHYLLRPRVLEHLTELFRKGQRLDLLILPRHLPVAAEALSKLPELPAVVDHCAKPDLRSGQLDAWRAGLARLAEFPSVYCKLSGLVTEAPPGFTASDLAPAVEHALAVFGDDRLIFGSDWPVCTLAASYERVVAVLREVLGGRLAPAFEKKLFGDNAARFYGL